MTEIREVLRLWLHGEGLRSIGQLTVPDRKTIRRYVQAADQPAAFRLVGQVNHPGGLGHVRAVTDVGVLGERFLPQAGVARFSLAASAS